MKTLFLILSTLWTLTRNTPAFVRHLPSALALIGKIRAVFGSEAVQELMKALHAFIDRITPPTQATDGSGTIPVPPKQERRRRLFRFRDRLEVAGIITDDEAEKICALHTSNTCVGVSGTDGWQTDGDIIDGVQLYRHV